MKEINVPRVAGFEDIDSFAHDVIDTVNWPDEFPYKPEVCFRIAHNGSKLLIRFEVKEDAARAVCTTPNGPVWEDSCVEFFVKEPQSDQYFNFETNCIGTGLASKRRSREEFTRFSAEQMALITRRSSLEAVPFEECQPKEWTLDLEVPFATICTAPGTPSCLMANFYKCGDKTGITHFLSWNPVPMPKPDFHRPEYFGKLILL